MEMTKETAEFNNFKIPKEFFEKFYEFTGSQDESSRGFIVAYVNQDGCPIVYTRAANPVVELGLEKALEDYFEDKSKDASGFFSEV